MPGRTQYPSTEEAQEVFDAMAEFEQTNPQVAEAMRLFGMTQQEFEAAFIALHVVHIYSSDSTTNNAGQPHAEHR